MPKVNHDKAFAKKLRKSVPFNALSERPQKNISELPKCKKIVYSKLEERLRDLKERTNSNKQPQKTDKVISLKPAVLGQNICMLPHSTCVLDEIDQLLEFDKVVMPSQHDHLNPTPIEDDKTLTSKRNGNLFSLLDCDSDDEIKSCPFQLKPSILESGLIDPDI
jgi:hypothetical protein